MKSQSKEDMHKKRKQMWLEYKILTELLYVGSILGILATALALHKVFVG